MHTTFKVLLANVRYGINKHQFPEIFQKFNIATIAVEGNIGCGKTRLINHFEKLCYVQACSEPVSNWRNIDGHNVLKYFYDNPRKGAMALHSYCQLSMIKTHLLPCSKPIKLMERSLYSVQYCFLENLKRCEQISEMEHIILSNWFHFFVSLQIPKLDQILYIRTNPKVALERIRKRNRPEEQVISLEYLENLHTLHDMWLIDGVPFTQPAPVLVLDGNKINEDMDEIYEDTERKCANFFKLTNL